MTDPLTEAAARTSGFGLFYGADRARPELLLAPKQPGEHVWMFISTHVLDVDTVRRAQRGEQLHLDAENLATVVLGCFICEEPWTDRISYRRCTGEPT